MMQAYIEAVGLCGPGLPGWAASQPILAGHAAYSPTPAAIPPCPLLPPAERRRAPKMVRLALAVGTEAFTAAGRTPAATPAVFTSSGGDGETIHDILTTLATPERALSPTKFHNSVHNAAAGYWSIATGATAAATSLCAHDDSFAAGLLEALTQTAAVNDAVALIAYDVPYPAPLFAARPVGAVFGTALLLAPRPSPAAFARLTLSLTPGPAVATPSAPALEELRSAAPTARALPLLEALAALSRHGPASAGNPIASAVTLRYLDDMALTLTLAPA